MNNPTLISKKLMCLSAAIALPLIITGCPGTPITPSTISVLLETYSYGPNSEYYTSNNDGSLMMDRPYAPDTSYGPSTWVSAQFSSTGGVCKNFDLGSAISGVSSGDFDETVEINSNGDINLPYVSFEEVDPNSRIDFLACSDIGATTSALPEIPYAEERAIEVIYDYPFIDEVTIDFPFVLRGDDADLTDEEALLPISIYSESLNDVCYYYGFGPALEYVNDEGDWEITSVVGVREGYAGMLKDFDVISDDYYNDGFASITCELPTKDNTSDVADKLNPRVKDRVQTRDSLVKRAQKKGAQSNIKNGNQKVKRSTKSNPQTPEKRIREEKMNSTPLFQEVANIKLFPRGSEIVKQNATQRINEPQVTGDISLNRPRTKK